MREAIKIIQSVGLWERRKTMKQKTLIHRAASGEYKIVNLRTLRVRTLKNYPNQTDLRLKRRYKNQFAET